MHFRALFGAMVLLLAWNSFKAQDVARRVEAQPAVTITSRKPVFMMGEPITLKVEVTNRGEVPFYIPREITTIRGGRSTLDIVVADSAGKKSSFQFGHVYLVLDKNSEEPLSEFWVHLHPGYSYSRDITLDGSTHHFLSKAGRYQISGTFETKGATKLDSLKGKYPLAPITIEVR